MWNAMKTKPFQSPFLSKLAWDSKVHNMIERHRKAVIATLAQLRGSFETSKTHLAHSL